MKFLGNVERGRRTSVMFRSLLFAALLGAGFCLPVAHAGGGGGEGGPDGNKSGDIGTLPFETSDGPGFGLFGDPTEIEDLIKGARGYGSVQVFERGQNRVLVTFTGNWNLRLDRRALASTNVRILLLGGESPVLDLPVADLSTAGVRGLGLDLLVGSRAKAVRNVAFFRQRTVTLIQRTQL